MLVDAYDAATAKAWLFGTNTRLDDRAPIDVLGLADDGEQFADVVRANRNRITNHGGSSSRPTGASTPSADESVPPAPLAQSRERLRNSSIVVSGGVRRNVSSARNSRPSVPGSPRGN
jgi:hypothetical protein